MNAKSRAERAEERAAGRTQPLCPSCGHGNLAGVWRGPLGHIESGLERGAWYWECLNCDESGPWLPDVFSANPFTDGRALVFDADLAGTP